MKKIILLFLAFVLSFCFCGCQEVVHNDENKEWAPGYIEDDTYINEFAGIKFVKNSAWAFHKNLGVYGENPTYDMVADSTAINHVEVAFVQAQNAKQDSAEEYLENMIEMIPRWEFDDITEKYFCGQKYFCVDGTLSVNNYRCYTRAINNYIVIVNIFAVDMDISEIEGMFCKIEE